MEILVLNTISKIEKYEKVDFLGVRQMGQLLGRSNGGAGADDVDVMADSTRAAPSRKRRTIGDSEMETRKKKISKVCIGDFRDCH